MFLTDGYRTIITLANDPTIKLYEVEVTPPPISIGKSIDQTTMRNLKYRTQAPAVLIMLGEGKVQVAYDPIVQHDMESQLGVNQLITYQYPDGSTYAFYGWVDSFTQTALKEGTRPIADMVLAPSLRNNASPPVETPPVYVAGS